MVKMSILTDLQIQYNPNQNSKKVFWRFHTSQFYMEHVYEKEEPIDFKAYHEAAVVQTAWMLAKG